jgi:hypothetical protein
MPPRSAFKVPNPVHRIEKQIPYTHGALKPIMGLGK